MSGLLAFFLQPKLHGCGTEHFCRLCECVCVCVRARVCVRVSVIYTEVYLSVSIVHVMLGSQSVGERYN